MPLPKFLEPFLPSYDISKMDLYDPADKREIIIAILNQGDEKDLKWLLKTYSLKDIKEVLRDPGRGIWFRDVLYYWTKILNIKLPRIVFEAAIFDLNPRPKLIMRYFNYLKRKGRIPKETLKIWQEIDRLEKLKKHVSRSSK